MFGIVILPVLVHSGWRRIFQKDMHRWRIFLYISNLHTSRRSCRLQLAEQVFQFTKDGDHVNRRWRTPYRAAITRSLTKLRCNTIGFIFGLITVEFF